ncbi:hypothetical protein [Corynebacterium glucuronolyticum]|uniref:Uncharacterized protein n=1 Tax=Corynebacterium glucuronolyticum ATCC 51866 TaxID=548478 RepID=A0ABM9XLY0_9CORY|nr:hypothetical protein [Corynebacterium glucuronolyticum]EEI62146.1 hypothetical protein HMPREF0293_2271 [Corynebacterium glucuronolyticum ATCC 51866]
MAIPPFLIQGIPLPFCPRKMRLFEVQGFPPHFDIPTITALFHVMHGAILAGIATYGYSVLSFLYGPPPF